MELETIIPWGPVTEISTRIGPRKIRTAVPTEEFWAMYRVHKDTWKDAGIAVTKYQGEWIATWWLKDESASPRPVVTQPKPAPAKTAVVNAPAPVPVPASVAEKLRDYQVHPTGVLGAAFHHWNAALDASDMGTGKSFAALGACLTLGRRPFIICRKNAFPSWRRYCDHFGIPQNEIVLTNLEMVRRGTSPLGRWEKRKTSTGRNYEAFEWSVPDDFLMIFDEVHSCAGIDSQNSDLLIGAAWQNLKTLLVSATAANSPLKMRAIGYALGLHRIKDFNEWLVRHGCSEGKFGFEFNCGMSITQYKHKKGSEWIDIPEGVAELERRRDAFMQEIHNAIFPQGKGVRMKIENIPGFPSNLIIPEAIDFEGATKDIANAYAELELELASLKRNENIQKRAAMKRAQMKIEKFKLPLIAEQVKADLKEGYSCIVFTNYNETLDELMVLLKTDCVIRGGQTEAERKQHEDAFQSNRSRLILCNNQAGGESISLHDLHGGHPRKTRIFPTFWAEVMRQCAGRAPRNGGKTPVVQYIPFAAGTVEEAALTSTTGKLQRVDTLNNGMAALIDNDLLPMNLRTA